LKPGQSIKHIVHLEYTAGERELIALKGDYMVGNIPIKRSFNKCALNEQFNIIRLMFISPLYDK